MKAGAVGFLAKPFGDGALLAAVEQAVAECQHRVAAAKELAELCQWLGSLSSREREVLSLVAGGKLNKQIATELGIAVRTVKLHRAHMMEKLGIRNVPDLVRLLGRAEAGSSVGEGQDAESRK